MHSILRYRGRAVSAADLQQIRALIAAHPQANRQRLSKELCVVWNWRQENGALKDMICRGLLLALHRGGLIQLPPAQRVMANPLIKRARPPLIECDRTPIEGSLKALPPLYFRQVRRASDEPLFNSMLEQHHPLKFSRPVGEHLKFMVYAGSRPVALFAWSSAPRHLGPRDRYIGWDKERRRPNIRFIPYSTRYLIPEWVRVPHLASHLLARMTRMLSEEWVKLYKHPVYFAETFVDPTRHRGTCYKAANWVCMGRTTGRGKADQTHRANRSLKDVWGLPLCADFREKLLA